MALPTDRDLQYIAHQDAMVDIYEHSHKLALVNIALCTMYALTVLIEFFGFIGVATVSDTNHSIGSGNTLTSPSATIWTCPSLYLLSLCLRDNGDGSQRSQDCFLLHERCKWCPYFPGYHVCLNSGQEEMMYECVQLALSGHLGDSSQFVSLISVRDVSPMLTENEQRGKPWPVSMYAIGLRLAREGKSYLCSYGV